MTPTTPQAAETPGNSAPVSHTSLPVIQATYPLSRDYPALYQLLLQGAEVACWVDYSYIPGGNTYRDISSIRRKEAWRIEIGVRGRSYGSVFHNYNDGYTEEAYFTAECTRLSLQFIPPVDVRAIAGEAWEYGRRHGVESMSPGCFPTATDKTTYLNSLLNSLKP